MDGQGEAGVDEDCESIKQNCLQMELLGEDSAVQNSPLTRGSDEIKNELSSQAQVMDEKAVQPVDIENVLSLPVYGLQCPCGPQCKTFTVDTHSPDHFSPASDDKTQNAVSDVCVCKREKSPSPVSDFEHLKMEFESSIGKFQEEEDGYFEMSGHCQQNVFLSDKNEYILKDDHFYTESGQDDASHPYLGGLKLDELDDDTLLHIASCTEARSVKYGLSQACQRFKDIFDKNAYWKTRINKKWRKRYPAVEAPDDFSWEDACIAGEDCQRIWSNPVEHTHHFMYACNVYAEVDALHLMQHGKILISGDRNRNLNIINLAKYNPESMTDMKGMLEAYSCNSHKGWIWSITSVGNKVITGSWDTRIRIFDLNSDLKSFDSFKCKSAVLSLYAEENYIVGGCFDKRIFFFDGRNGKETSHIYHNKAVLSVAGNEDFIISGSEDKTVAVFDRKAGKVLNRFQLADYPLCMSFRDNQLWLGDKSGLIHLYDANERMFDHVGTYNVGHKGKVTDIKYTPGSLFTCSMAKGLSILTPTRDPEEIYSIGNENKELAKVDYSCGVLASSGGNESIALWLPKSWGKGSHLL